MGQPKSKRTAMLDPRHRAKLLKEKYRQQLAERRELESDSTETQPDPGRIPYKKRRNFSEENISKEAVCSDR